MPEPSKPLLRAEITVQSHSFDPKKGKEGSGSLKSSEGTYYGVFGEAGQRLLNQFQTGEVCVIEYTETPRQNGGTWKNLKHKVSSTPTALQKPPYIAPKQRTDDRDQEQITVRLIMDKLITPDKTYPEIAEIMQKARQLYRMTWNVDKPENPDINDDIQF